MIVKTDAIALRIRPHGATSRIVTWLTPSRGKLSTLAKGSQRPRSPFLGQFDSFYECQILYYDHTPSTLHLLKECAPLAPHPRFRADYRSCAAASYAASLVDRAVPHGPHAPPGLYPLLRAALADFAARTPGPATLLRFEAALLHHLGLLPDWRNAPHPSPPAPEMPLPPPVALQALDALRRDPSPPSPPAAGLPKTTYLHLRDLLGTLLERHADLSPVPRRIAYSLLRP